MLKVRRQVQPFRFFSWRSRSADGQSESEVSRAALCHSVARQKSHNTGRKGKGARVNIDHTNNVLMSYVCDNDNKQQHLEMRINLLNKTTKPSRQTSSSLAKALPVTLKCQQPACPQNTVLAIATTTSSLRQEGRNVRWPRSPLVLPTGELLRVITPLTLDSKNAPHNQDKLEVDGKPFGKCLRPRADARTHRLTDNQKTYCLRALCRMKKA